MFYFLAFLICMATALFIGAPLFQRGRQAEEGETVGFHLGDVATDGTPTSSALAERRDALLLALKELEFDHSMGKIEEGDYVRLRAATTTEAATVLNQLESARASFASPTMIGSAGVLLSEGEAAVRDAEIEAEILIARARQRRRREKSARGSQTEGWLCTQCGRAMSDTDRFCATCGTPRTQTVSS
jgi:rubrerythrin